MAEYLFITPLAEYLRPSTLNEYLGQDIIKSDNSILRKMIETDDYSSFILWGPPGSGKTTLASIIKSETKNNFVSMSAVTTGIKEVKDLMKETQESYGLYQTKTILFIDEIHRFNKAQQDAFLSYVENGSIILIGATTENPSFSVISPLLSRMRVFTLSSHNQKDITSIINKAIEAASSILKTTFHLDESDIETLGQLAGGDARRAVGMVETAVKLSFVQGEENINIPKEIIKKVLDGRHGSYDKTGGYHYDFLSALHKSMRNSDVNAALYYGMRMLDSGEDPRSLIRRVIQCSSEDIGLADPQALVIATAAQIAVTNLGMPEAALSILQAIAYNALAPKSNALYKAMNEIKKDINSHPDIPIPLHLRNGVTSLMKDNGYGENYKYAHDYEIPVADMQCLPNELKNKQYYKPSNFGFEKELAKRINAINKINNP